MIRPAVLSDLHEILGIARDEARQYRNLKVDMKKIHKGVIQAISSAKHFCWVEVNDQNYATGVLIGLTSENLWAQRSNCLVVLWYSKVVGNGVKLLRAFKKWVQSRRLIRVAGFVPDSNHIGQRPFLLAERMGFSRCGGAYLLYN
jgi:hypothetical protein